MSYDKYGNGLTIRYLRDLAAQRFRAAQTRFSTMFGDRRESPWYAVETFARNEVPTAGWSLVRNGVIPRSLGQTWKEQWDTLRQWTGENIIQPEIVRRRTAVEAVYDALMFWGRNRQSEMDMVFDWTATTSSDGWPVFVGCHDSRLWVDALPQVTRDPCVGVCPCLSATKDPVR